MNNYRHLIIDTRGFERNNGRNPTNQEKMKILIDSFEGSKDSYPKDGVEYKKDLSDSMAMYDCYLRGDYVDITKEIK